MNKRDFKIFIVEDDKLQNKMMQEAILNQFENCLIYPFYSAESALGSLKLKPDFILIDHFLEKLNGIESLPIFREYAPNSKIIVISAQHHIKNFENAFLYGADAYYTKDGQSIRNVISYLTKEINNLKSNWFKSVFKKFSTQTYTKKNKLIYILEDNCNSAFSIEHVLQNGTLNRVIPFNNSIDFISQVRITKPDVVILDYVLEENLTGGDVLQVIKKISKKTEIIIFSNQTNVNTATELINMGATHFFMKSNENLLRLKGLINSN